VKVDTARPRAPGDRDREPFAAAGGERSAQQVHAAPSPRAGRARQLLRRRRSLVAQLRAAQGSTQCADEPELDARQLQGLLEVTERRDLLRDALTARGGEGLTISIGQSTRTPAVHLHTGGTSTYRFGPLTRRHRRDGADGMDYDKIVALVSHTSRLVGELLE